MVHMQQVQHVLRRDSLVSKNLDLKERLSYMVVLLMQELVLVLLIEFLWDHEQNPFRQDFGHRELSIARENIQSKCSTCLSVDQTNSERLQ